MKRKLIVAAFLCAAFLVSAATSFAGVSTYAGPMYWSCSCGYSSSYSSGWTENDFSKSTSGVSDTMVTLIDNGVFGYSWHGTVRNTASFQHAWWGESYVKKGYCRFYDGTAFNGSCFVAG